mmetsp:Transcript_11461/g.17073  ORF Transcript_11461/g.17073 Transcript_11461/m.17073 type:complete len:543 (-) Transcript_11461:1417-3045(-)
MNQSNKQDSTKATTATTLKSKIKSGEESFGSSTSSSPSSTISSSPTLRTSPSSSSSSHNNETSPNLSKSSKNNRQKSPRKQYKAPRGVWNDEEAVSLRKKHISNRKKKIMSNMTPDGPKDATVALEYQMWGDEGVPFLEEEDDDEEVESGKEEEIDTKKLQLNCVGWKLRSGLGKFNVKHAWEPRRFVLDGNKLSYYEIANNGIDDDVIVGGSDQKVNTTEEEEAAGVECIEQEQQPSPKRGCGAILNEDSKEKSKSKAENIKGQDEGIDDDDKNATADAANDITIKTESPRGTIELSQEKEASIEPSEENASSSSNPLSASAISSSVKSTVIPSPTPYVLKISLPEDHISWRFCFHDRKTQMTWCNALRKITGTEEDENKQIHNFEPGDHVVRWEMIMLPVLVWPIQIHGIVLEAGRNCVIIADFGLTSYGPGDGGAENEDGNNSKSDRQRKKKTNEEKKDDDESSKQKEKEHHDFSMEAWKKLRPKEKRRLNVIVLTDIHEIKKWTKVNYGRNFFKKKDGKKKMMSSISSWFGKKIFHGI